jgi:predicted dehydrogenase
MTARPTPIRVALAGAGMISHYHLIGWRNAGASRVKLVAVYDPDRARAETRAREFGIPKVYDKPDAMLDQEGIDALDVASPRETHAFWVEAAAARGIDVLCQKPMTPTLEESQSLARRVAGKVRLMVHENWRFRPWYREIKKWIAAGEIGDITACQMALLSSGLLPDASGRRPALVRQPFMADEPRMLIAETLIHHIDTVRWLVGPLRVVSARASRAVPEVKGESLATILMETSAGVPVTVMGTMAAPGFPSRTGDRLELIGRTATATLEATELQLRGPKPRHQSYDHDVGYQASFDGVIAHFVDCLATGAPFETDPVDNLETLRLVEHAYWAAGIHGPTSRQQEKPA